MKKEKSCGAIIYKHESNKLYILLLKHNLGHWSFPKGHIKPGETEIETAIREIKEETNLEVTLDNKFKHTITYSPYPNTIKDVVYFIATPTSNNIKPQEEEISQIKWYEENDVLNIVTYAEDKKLLTKALDYLHNRKQ